MTACHSIYQYIAVYSRIYKYTTRSESQMNMMGRVQNEIFESEIDLDIAIVDSTRDLAGTLKTPAP